MADSALLLTPSEKIRFLDPSEHLRPEASFASKPLEAYRDFSIDENDPIKERVRRTYLEMHTNQTVAFVQSRIERWTRFNTLKANIMDALDKLNDLVDESDPDVDIPNIVHAFQTAERIRADHPDQDWFHLTGLIHDLGKLPKLVMEFGFRVVERVWGLLIVFDIIMAFYDEPQWATVGDTFALGCAYAPSIVYRETSFHNNPDLYDERYNTKYGIYKPNCGLENVLISWGHDEYLYRVLKHNKCTIPEEGLAMIRFHSFYPWHSGKDYMHLCTDNDLKMMEWVLEFNKYDLYTKSTDIPDIEALKPYYQTLIDKYIPGELEW